MFVCVHVGLLYIHVHVHVVFVQINARDCRRPGAIYKLVHYMISLE